MHLTPATATVLATLLAEGFTAATVLAHYTHAADTEQTQTFEVAAWYTRYRVLGGQTVPVYAELTERYNRRGNWLGYEATLAAVQVEEHCPSLFGGCVVPGSRGTDFQSKPATRDLSGQGFAFPRFAAQPGVVLTPEGERFLALTQPLAQAETQARAELEASFQASWDADARAIELARKPRAGERVTGSFVGSGSTCTATVTKDWDGNTYGFVNVRSDADQWGKGYTGAFHVTKLAYLEEVGT